MLFKSQHQEYENNTLQQMFLSSLSFIFFLPFAIAWIAGEVRRLHDIGIFGWWVFIVLVPVYLFLDNWILIAPLLFLFSKMDNIFTINMDPIRKIQMHQFH